MAKIEEKVVVSSASDGSHNERFGLPSFEDNIFVVFGYGSILWKQNFEYAAAYDAYVKGYKRVFYQGSCDHRGVPGKPGRVVTLLPDASEARVYGKAFVLPCDPEKLAEIFNALDVREQGGYIREILTLYDAHPSGDSHSTAAVERKNHLEKVLDVQGKSRDAKWKAETAGKHGVVCLCYIATEENDEYLGEASIEEMARQIVNCEGPSGPNVDYLTLLADCLRDMEAEDEHVYSLDEAARRIMKEQQEEEK